jgi:hypothetical protein
LAQAAKFKIDNRQLEIGDEFTPPPLAFKTICYVAVGSGILRSRQKPTELTRGRESNRQSAIGNRQ